MTRLGGAVASTTGGARGIRAATAAGGRGVAVNISSTTGFGQVPPAVDEALEPESMICLRN